MIMLVSTAVSQASVPVILVLGDSLSAAYGIERSAGWVSLLQSRISSEGFPHRVVNASISGDTSAGGLNRLSHALDREHPSILIIALGSNDGLRGLDLGATRENLAGMIDLARADGCRPLLIGMQMPPNFGRLFTERFQHMFHELSQEKGVPLVPFLLDGVALRPELMQGDGLHPNAAAQPLILDNIWPQLYPLLKQRGRSQLSERRDSIG